MNLICIKQAVIVILIKLRWKSKTNFIQRYIEGEYPIENWLFNIRNITIELGNTISVLKRPCHARHLEFPNQLSPG